MSLGRSPRHYTHTELFLVRIWTRDANTGTGDEAGAIGPDLHADGENDYGDTNRLEWQGTVQRTMDGDAHQFSSWQGLQDLILAMLLHNRRR